MKLKTVYSSIALIFLVVGLALWKLNETYRAEKVSVKQNQLQTQLTALRSSLVSQISQLRNTLSTYTVQIDESKINWVQLKPFYALAVAQEDSLNRLSVNKLFLQSGSVADRWNSMTLEQNLNAKVSGNQLLRVQTFKDASGMVHLAITVFDREKRNNQPRSGVMVVGDISYFQRFFDLQRTSSVTQVLLTADKTVTAHTEYEYVGNLSDENKVSEKNFSVDRQELRGANLTLLSYTSKNAQSNFDIPFSMLGIIVGLGFVMSGILLFVAKPETARAVLVAAAAPVAQPMVRRSNLRPTEPAPVNIPLEFDIDAQVVPIQVQACVQQAIFNLDRQLKSQSVVIEKEFVSGEAVLLDYPKFIKIFENILLNMAANLPNGKKRIQLRSYDVESVTVLEIQAPLEKINLHEGIVPALIEANAEFSRVASSAGESIFRFSFTRQEVAAVQEPVIARSAALSEARFELNNADDSEFKMSELKLVNPVQNDLDIDALLSLDDESLTSESKINIEKEMQPTKFKLDEKMSIVEDPVIDIETTENKKTDQTKVKIRRPEKG